MPSPQLLFLGTVGDPLSEVPSRARYAFNTRGFGSHQAIIEFVESGTKILDVGCSSGYLMELLHSQRGCHCCGIEFDPSTAEQAEKKGFRVLRASIENGAGELLKLGPFDHVIFGDVLEHTVNPEKVLNETHQLLAPGGSIIVSLPNIVSLMSRLKILLGWWNYTDMGIMDRTHLRFFSYKSARQLMHDGGFEVERELFVSPLTFHGGRLLEPVQHFRPNLLANQFIFKASPLPISR